MPIDYPELTITDAAPDGTSVSVKMPALPSGAVSWTLKRSDIVSRFGRPYGGGDSLPVNQSDLGTLITVASGLTAGNVATISGIEANCLYGVLAVALNGSGGTVSQTDVLGIRIRYIAPPSDLPLAPRGPIFLGFTDDSDGHGLKAFLQAPEYSSPQTLLRWHSRVDGGVASTPHYNNGFYKFPVESGKSYEFWLSAKNAVGVVVSDEILRIDVPAEDESGGGEDGGGEDDGNRLRGASVVNTPPTGTTDVGNMVDGNESTQGHLTRSGGSDFLILDMGAPYNLRSFRVNRATSCYLNVEFSTTPDRSGLVGGTTFSTASGEATNSISVDGARYVVVYMGSPGEEGDIIELQAFES